MNHLFILKNKSHGFTLVETLIAIAVLMISIAGPLVVASKGLNSALFARDQMVASLLAQETLELVKNIRDNNVGGETPVEWLTSIDSCTSADTCDISAYAVSNYTFSPKECFDESTGGCVLYYDEDKGYNSDSFGNESIFRRYFYLTDEVNGGVEEKRVTVVVGWSHGTLDNEITLKSVLVNAKR
jgi:prepilin-type N-terminal cleavage/methylation domain-containing protein